MYHVLIPKKEVSKLQTKYNSVDQQEKAFKVVEPIYHVLITKKEVLKLRSLYITC